MTILKCSATKCMYNENELCSRGDIEITGAGARNADETNCGSFRERNASGAAMNSEAHHCGCEKINIDCKAQECTHYSIFYMQEEIKKSPKRDSINEECPGSGLPGRLL